MSAAVQEHGTRLVCQLFHGGREMIASGTAASGRRPELDPLGRGSRPSRARSREPRSPRCSTATGRRPPTRREGGLDGVEVCAGFGYLPTQFLSRHANVRTDEYGGSFENRLRFLREVLEAMREGFGPGGAVGCRLTDESTSAVGTDPDDVLAAAGAVGATTGWPTTSRSRSGRRRRTAARRGSCRRRRRPANAIAEFAAAVKARTAASR